MVAMELRPSVLARAGSLTGVAIALALPVAGLALLLARPELDLDWQHQPSHFWLVLVTALLSVGLALLTNEAASRRADARIVLVSLAFLASAGFLGLHALATPGVLLPEANAGFFVATPVGLAIAGVLAAISTSPFGGPRAAFVLRHREALRLAILGLIAAWGAISLLRLPPLDGPPPESLGPAGTVGALITVALFILAAWRYAAVAVRRGSHFGLIIAAALVLLAEAMLAVAFSRSWHLSWWEWHLLMAVSFGLIALGARREYRRTGSLVATFEPAYLQATLERIDRWHGRAIADLAAAEARGEASARILADLRREGASVEELALMRDAASEIRRVDERFRPYLPQAVAERVREGGAGRRGVERTISVVFADLAGFTTYSEAHAPTDVLDMLNTYWEAAVPLITQAGGSIEHFAGDAVLVTFNAVADQPDHAQRAVRCALELVALTDAIAAAHPGWPRFRAGVNTGPAAVGTIGGHERHTFAAIGDTTNLGARLSTVAEPGGVVIGPGTHATLGGDAALAVQALGPVRVKGKREPVAAWAVSRAMAP
jgi:adenylate cyclase